MTQPRPVTGKGARGRLVSCAVATALMATMAVSWASAEPRASRLHRTSAARISAARIADAPEPRSTRANHLRSRADLVEPRWRSVRMSRRSVESNSRSRLWSRKGSSRTEFAKLDRRSPRFATEARERRRESIADRRSSAAISPTRGGHRRSENSRAEFAARSSPETAARPLTTDDFLRAASERTAGANTADRSPATLHQAVAPLSRPSRQPLVEARVEANDPVAAPVERPAALRPITDGEVDDSGGVSTQDAAKNDVAADRNLSSQPDGVSRVLAHPSRQDLADKAVQPIVLPGLYRDGRLVMPAPLKGSRDILVHQNLMADEEGLERIRDDEDLDRLRASHQLVDFPESASLRLNPELAADRRCARVWTVDFAADIARAFYARFHEPLQVNSAVRTVQYQLRLERVNGNAAPVAGDVASPHLTGQAIDFGKGEMSRDEIAWMRAYLLPLMQAGKIDVEEEFQQACFHISVYRSYAPARKRTAVKTEVAEMR